MHKYTATKALKTASIVGARGYTGLELARILLRHPGVQLTHCYATQKFSLASLVSNPLAKNVICETDLDIQKNPTDFVFLATPAEVSIELAPKILAAGKTVIDLSGAFRLKKNGYKKWYGFEHAEQSLLQQAEYGLLPFVGPKQNQPKLISNPGCYASAVMMALIPLLKKGLLDPSSIVIDAKSGTSGAGKKATENLLFTEVDGECLPYKVGKHQHLPEIIEYVEKYSGIEIDPHFTTSLLATRRGIIASIFANTNASIEQIEQAFAEVYDGNSLVSFARTDSRPELLSLKQVVGTAKTHITYQVVGKKLFLFSCIDNLLKGAAAQAVENMNRVMDLGHHTGLECLEALT